jgi:transcriptional antiterminator Rof (Rho-off)
MCTRLVIVLQMISCNSFDYLVIALITWRIKLVVLRVIYCLWLSLSCNCFDYLIITFLCFDYLVIALTVL